MTKYSLKISPNLSIDLPLIDRDGNKYYSFNLLGQTELNKKFARLLAERLHKYWFDVIVTVEAKAISLVQELSVILGIPRYVVIRKSKKSYMDNPSMVYSNTIISGNSQYWIDGSDLEYLKDKKILFCDDVISTGGTVFAVLQLLDIINNKPLVLSCALVEGTEKKFIQDIEIITCGYFPLPGGHNDR